MKGLGGFGIFPVERKYYVLPFKGEALTYFLRRNVVSAVTADFTDRWIPKPPEVPFHGVVHDMDFELTPKLNYIQHLLPVLKGQIENTSRGCIVRVTLKLTEGTRFFLLFASIIGIVTGLVFFFLAQKELYAFITWGLVLCNYFFSLGGYLQQRQRGRETLEELFNKIPTDL